MIVQHLLVAMQLGALAVMGWGAFQAWPWPGWFWVPLALSGALMASAAVSLGDSLTPHPSPNLKGLKTGGIYGVVRHPMYLALAIAGIGVAVLRPWTVWVLLILLGSLAGKIVIEERLLRGAYPQFDEYSKKTWRVLPFLW